jgi:hypothetical protein
LSHAAAPNMFDRPNCVFGCEYGDCERAAHNQSRSDTQPEQIRTHNIKAAEGTRYQGSGEFTIRGERSTQPRHTHTHPRTRTHTAHMDSDDSTCVGKLVTRAMQQTDTTHAHTHTQGMRVGDRILFYHSSCKVPGVAGLAVVAKTAYPDHTAWDASSKYYDPKSQADAPKW